MSDSFWQMVGVVLPVIVIQLFQYMAARKNAIKSEVDRQEIKAQVCEVKDHLQSVSLAKKDVDLMIAGAERKIFASGIEEGKRQATGPMPLEK